MEKTAKSIELTDLTLSNGEIIQFNLVKDTDGTMHVRVGNTSRRTIKLIEFYIDDRLTDKAHDIKELSHAKLCHVRLSGVKVFKFKVTHSNGETTDITITKEALNRVKADIRK